MRILRHDLRRRYSNSLVIDAGSQFSLRACSQATGYKVDVTTAYLIDRYLHVFRNRHTCIGAGHFDRQALKNYVQAWAGGREGRSLLACLCGGT
jgi:hypothetical protein